MFRERRQIVICIVAGAMVGGFVLFRYLPLQERMKSVERTKAAQMLAIAEASSEGMQLPALKEQLLKLQGLAGNYERQVPVGRDLGVFLHRITNLMNEHNLEGQLIQLGQEIEAGGLNCIPVDMQCKGRLAQLFEFYKSLQSMDRLIRIEQVKLESESDFSGEVSMQTQAVVYYRSKARQIVNPEP